MVVVRDILDSVQRITGSCDQSYLFGILSLAVKTLANKANQQGIPWDPLLVYVDLPVTSEDDGYYITLPSHVDKPIKININGNPAFSHGQLFEFSLNGPGSGEIEVGFQWQDRGYTALQHPLPGPPSSFYALSDNPSDVTLSLNVLINNPDGTEAWVDVPINGNALSPMATDVLKVKKPVTLGNVSVYAEDHTLLSVYDPEETFPYFTKVKLSQQCAAVRMLCRRRTPDITSVNDVIPLYSEMAIILMCNAVKMYQELQWDNASAAEQKAIQFLQEEQDSRNIFAAAASVSESPTALNLSIANRDSCIAADIYDATSAIFGPVGQARLFDKMTMAVEVLANMGIWDPLEGYADISLGTGGYLTLPRQVEQILSMNVNGRPQEFRSKWFEFHINGPGSRNEYGWCACEWSEYGEVCVAFDPVAFAPVAATPYDWRDLGRQVVIYGTDVNGIELLDPDGTKGYTLTVSDDLSTFAAGPKVATFERVEKDPTYGFIQLATTDGTAVIQNLATYYPDDTIPLYRRIRVGSPSVYPYAATSSATARIRFRKRWSKITSLTDPIPLRSRQALVTALTAVKTSETDPDAGRALLEVAKQYLREEWRAVNPRQQVEFQMSRNWGGAFNPVF